MAGCFEGLVYGAVWSSNTLLKLWNVWCPRRCFRGLWGPGLRCPCAVSSSQHRRRDTRKLLCLCVISCCSARCLVYSARQLKFVPRLTTRTRKLNVMLPLFNLICLCLSRPNSTGRKMVLAQNIATSPVTRIFTQGTPSSFPRPRSVSRPGPPVRECRRQGQSGGRDQATLL